MLVGMTAADVMRGLRSRVRSWPGGWVIWRVGVTIVGVAIVAVGIVLLPLPGPGWVIIFAGLGVLASEYAWAAALLRRAKDFFVWWRNWFERQPRWVHVLGGLLGLCLLGGLIYGGWWLYGNG
jgi:uncharacterized protein (TIGR02611 family)